MRTAWILGALVVGACSSDIQYVDDDDAGVSGGSGTHSLDAASEWGTGGSSGSGGTAPADSGMDVVEDVTTTDGPCTNVVPFDLAATADTQLDPNAASCGADCNASANWGHDVNLVVGLGACGGTEVLVRFDVGPALAAAFVNGRVETADLVLTTDPQYKGNSLAGTLNVFGMTSTWEEGTGLSRDGANWCYATVTCCAQHTGSSCCQYSQTWQVAGALGLQDSGPQAGLLKLLAFDQNTLTVPLTPSALQTWPKADRLSLMLRSDGALKLYLKSKDAGSPPRLQGTYCDIDGSN